MDRNKKPTGNEVINAVMRSLALDQTRAYVTNDNGKRQPIANLPEGLVGEIIPIKAPVDGTVSIGDRFSCSINVGAEVTYICSGQYDLSFHRQRI